MEDKMYAQDKPESFETENSSDEDDGIFDKEARKGLQSCRVTKIPSQEVFDLPDKVEKVLRAQKANREKLLDLPNNYENQSCTINFLEILKLYVAHAKGRKRARDSSEQEAEESPEQESEASPERDSEDESSPYSYQSPLFFNAPLRFSTVDLEISTSSEETTESDASNNAFSDRLNACPTDTLAEKRSETTDIKENAGELSPISIGKNVSEKAPQQCATAQNSSQSSATSSQENMALKKVEANAGQLEKALEKEEPKAGLQESEKRVEADVASKKSETEDLDYWMSISEKGSSAAVQKETLSEGIEAPSRSKTSICEDRESSRSPAFVVDRPPWISKDVRNTAKLPNDNQTAQKEPPKGREDAGQRNTHVKPSALLKQAEDSQGTDRDRRDYAIWYPNTGQQRSRAKGRAVEPKKKHPRKKTNEQQGHSLAKSQSGTQQGRDPPVTISGTQQGHVLSVSLSRPQQREGQSHWRGYSSSECPGMAGEQKGHVPVVSQCGNFQFSECPGKVTSKHQGHIHVAHHSENWPQMWEGQSNGRRYLSSESSGTTTEKQRGHINVAHQSENWPQQWEGLSNGRHSSSEHPRTMTGKRQGHIARHSENWPAYQRTGEGANPEYQNQSSPISSRTVVQPGIKLTLELGGGCVKSLSSSNIQEELISRRRGVLDHARPASSSENFVPQAKGPSTVNRTGPRGAHDYVNPAARDCEKRTLISTINVLNYKEPTAPDPNLLDVPQSSSNPQLGAAARSPDSFKFSPVLTKEIGKDSKGLTRSSTGAKTCHDRNRAYVNSLSSRGTGGPWNKDYASTPSRDKATQFAIRSRILSKIPCPYARMLLAWFKDGMDLGKVRSLLYPRTEDKGAMLQKGVSIVAWDEDTYLPPGNVLKFLSPAEAMKAHREIALKFGRSALTIPVEELLQALVKLEASQPHQIQGSTLVIRSKKRQEKPPETRELESCLGRYGEVMQVQYFKKCAGMELAGEVEYRFVTHSFMALVGLDDSYVKGLGGLVVRFKRCKANEVLVPQIADMVQKRMKA